jgi:hypothetical protein
MGNGLVSKSQHAGMMGPPAFQGQRVGVNYKGRGKFFDGHIDSANDNGTYDVRYDDGDFEREVRACNLRLGSPAKARAVEQTQAYTIIRSRNSNSTKILVVDGKRVACACAPWSSNQDIMQNRMVRTVPKFSTHCPDIDNASEIAGFVAVISRAPGETIFAPKAQAAAEAGATAVLIANINNEDALDELPPVDGPNPTTVQLQVPCLFVGGAVLESMRDGTSTCSYYEQGKHAGTGNGADNGNGNGNGAGNGDAGSRKVTGMSLLKHYLNEEGQQEVALPQVDM